MKRLINCVNCLIAFVEKRVDKMNSHKELLHMYFLHTENELEENVKEYENRIRRRSHDSIDFLELMLAEERLQAFNEFRSNILNLLNIGDNKEN